MLHFGKLSDRSQVLPVIELAEMNGMEKDDYIKGEGDSYDFGAITHEAVKFFILIFIQFCILHY
jgi:hypothetical protein